MRPPSADREGRSSKRTESGHLLVALMVLVAVMLILLTVTGQSWTFITRRDAEAEMVFRGEQYARALDFYRKELGSFPLELKLLAQPGPHRHRFIRKLWKDPVSKDGKWGILYLSPTGKGYINPYATRRDQEQFVAGSFGDSGPGGGSTSAFGRSSKPRGLGRGGDDEGDESGGYSELSKDDFEARGGERAGLPIVGVVHKKKESGFKIYKNQANLNDWAFTILAEGQEQEMRAKGGGATPGGFQGRGVGDAASPTSVPSARKPTGLGGNVNPAIEQMKEGRRLAAEAEKEKERQENADEEDVPPDQDDETDDQGDDDEVDEEDSEDEDSDEEGDPNAPADPNAAADPNAVADPNAPAAHRH